VVIMAPVPALVTQAVQGAGERAIINIFAGIPADKTAAVDMDAYIAKRMYFIGTSGSVLEDMKAVLAKVVSRRLDTNLSVAAVSGLDGAIEGIRAVEKNLLPGKILVYPSCKGLGLTPLGEAVWDKQAEEALLARFKKM
jgi:threonine dehydrogenase-like Zn-dependent dehydrogenase